MTIEAFSSIGKIWLGIETSPMVARTAEIASSTGHAGRHDRPEREDEDQERHGQRHRLGLVQVALDLLVERGARRRVSELLDAELGFGLLAALQRGHDGADPVRGRVELAP
jgi:hypothetical protein